MAASTAEEISSVVVADDDDEEEGPIWNLDTIPKELFLHICSFLRAKFVVTVLSRVCSRLNEIIKDETTWKIRLRKQMPKPYPLIPCSDYPWKQACCEAEDQKILWGNDASNMCRFDLKGAHFASVDVVQIIENGRFCVSGARDHAVKLWKLDNLSDQVETEIVNNACCAEVLAAHMGWIWSTAYSDYNHTLYTGSWDSRIRSWNIEGFSSCGDLSTYSSRSPILCLAFSDKVLVSGSYDKQVTFFDARARPEPISKHSHHRKAVLCIAADEKFVISGSEDNTVVIYNRVAGKVQNTIELEQGYAMSLSYLHNNLWVGDSKGCIHLVDPSEESFHLVQTFQSEHKGRINGIHYSLGSVISCSTDKKLIVSVPCMGLQQITTLPSKSEYAGISAYGQIVASANCDDSITIWMPKDDIVT